jgi:hypothetical protein
MNLDQMQEALADIFDQAIEYHGFTDYMRDYEIIIHATGDPRTGIPPTYLRCLFKYCVEAHVYSAVSPEAWRQSLDDLLIDYEIGKHLDGYVWGVRCQGLYPGAEIVADSERAQHWHDSIGIDFHEVRFETNGHNITLVFSDLEVTEPVAGYAPYSVREAPS